MSLVYNISSWIFNKLPSSTKTALKLIVTIYICISQKKKKVKYFFKGKREILEHIFYSHLLNVFSFEISLLFLLYRIISSNNSLSTSVMPHFSTNYSLHFKFLKGHTAMLSNFSTIFPPVLMSNINIFRRMWPDLNISIFQFYHFYG